MKFRYLTLSLLLFASWANLAFAHPLLEGELIFPLEHWHNHGSCLVECSNGDILTCWFHGSGERTADNVEILGARLVKKTGRWTKPFSMADTPGFPDTNCCMVIDQHGTLWLLWPTIQANLWESALMKYKTSTDYMQPEGPPKWDLMRVLHVKHEGDFAAKVDAKAEAYLAGIERNEIITEPLVQKWREDLNQQAEDKLTRRIGWFTRAIASGSGGNRSMELVPCRLLGAEQVPLYNSEFTNSLIASTITIPDSSVNGN